MADTNSAFCTREQIPFHRMKTIGDESAMNFVELEQVG
jgi:hypothetical protein